MRGVVFADWRQAARRGKAHGSVEVILKQWEMGSARGLQDSCSNSFLTGTIWLYKLEPWVLPRLLPSSALICFEKSLTMALFADMIANNTGLPKLGDVRHHFEIRVLVGVGVVDPVVVVVV
eukprot:symbB.v1.2.025449.t1/scaffold2469.1/size78468/5